MKPYCQFAHGSTPILTQEMNPQWLGGKGFGLVEMAEDYSLPVPPGFIIPTGVHRAYRKNPEAVLEHLRNDVPVLLKELRQHLGYAPLLSVRSGAAVSMPGMMDTVLNVGLTNETFPFWKKRLGGTAAWDCRRRLAAMYAEIVCGLPKATLQAIEAKCLKAAKVDSIGKMTDMQLFGLCSRIDTTLSETLAKSVPETAEEQIIGAIEAVFCSWNSERAREYRRLNGISDDIGTAVTVQTMVFGNMNERSATGVLFTRCPTTGEPGIRGEFLVNAQGEDVVAGTHTPIRFSAGDNGHALLFNGGSVELAWPATMVEAFTQLIDTAKNIEAKRRDMQDIEFTIEDGKLWLLQTRNAKRSAAAAFRVVWDLYAAKQAITATEARKRLTARQFAAARRPTLNVEATAKECFSLGKGLPASKGVVVGRVAFNAAQLADIANAGDPVVLVRKETTPDDFPMMAKSAAIVTATGGFTSHAAVVARGMDKVCVVGWAALPSEHWDENNCSMVLLKGVQLPMPTTMAPGLSAGEWVTVDGETGEIWRGQGVLQPGASNLAEALVRAFATDEGLSITGIDYLTLAEVPPGDQHAFNDFCTCLTDRLAAGLPVTVDLRAPAELADAEDVDFLNGMGLCWSDVWMWEARLKNVRAILGNFKPTLFNAIDPTMPIPANAMATGIVRVCTSIDEALTAKGPVLFSREARRVLGDGVAGDIVRKGLEAQGVKFLPEPLTLDEAATRVLS